jgi:PAS domain S-box-containing protein
MTKTKMNPEIWRDVFDAIEDPAFLHDKQFRVLLANRAYCREAGVTEAQALGKPYWEVFPPSPGPLPGCKAAMDRKGQGGSQEEVSVGEKLFLSKSYTARDDQGKSLHALHILSDISAQRQAVVALAESEERFRRATETARDAIILLDGVSGVVIAWNPAAEVMFGYGKEEVIGRVLHDFLPPARFRAVGTKAMAHFASTGEGLAINQTRELVALHKNGTEFPIELSLSAAQIHGKWHATGIARDISERKRAEEALKKSEARYRSYIEVTGQLAWVTGADGAVVEDIPTWRAFAGLSVEQVKGWGWTEALHPDDRERAAQMWREAVARKGVYEVEYRVRRRDGIYRDFFARGVPVLDESGSVREWVGTSIDITERKKSEEGLKLFRALVDQSSDAIEVLDPETFRFLDVNQRACLALGYSREELLSLSASDIDPTLDRASITEMIKELRQLGSLTHEGCHRRKDGSEFPVEISLGYVLLDRAYIISIARDITERKQKDAELQMTVNRLSAAQHIGKLGFLDWDLLTNEIELSDETLRIYGLTPGANKLKFEEITKLVHPDDVEDAVKSLRNAIETGAKHDIEHRIIRADGTVIYVHTPAQVMRDTNGKPIRIVGTVQDITERKQAEAKLVEQFNELQRWNEAMQGREMRILDLKHEVNELLGKSGLPARYPSAESQD